VASDWGADEELSPGGTVRVRWHYDTGFVNNPFRSPELIDARTGDPLTRFTHQHFSGALRWLDNDCFALAMSDPHWGPDVRALVDPGAGTFRPLPFSTSSLEPTGPPRPLPELGPWMEQEMKIALAEDAKRGESERAQRDRRRHGGRYLIACVLVLIAVITLFV
jgi:hypothetical protein